MSNKILTGTDLDRSSFVAIAVAVCNKMLPLAPFVLVVAVVVALPKLGASLLYVFVTIATEDETSRGVAKACLQSVAGVGTILQVVDAKPRKPR